jgi:hypothetical protein
MPFIFRKLEIKYLKNRNMQKHRVSKLFLFRFSALSSAQKLSTLGRITKKLFL